MNIAFQLRGAARGGYCGVFISDMKLRILLQRIFYYPDVMLCCDSGDNHELYKDLPCLVAEVLSPSTEVTDRREKLFSYQQLPSLRYYLMVSSSTRRVEYFQREADECWYNGTLEEEECLSVVCDDYRCELTLTDIYEDVRLS